MIKSLEVFMYGSEQSGAKIANFTMREEMFPFSHNKWLETHGRIYY